MKLEFNFGNKWVKSQDTNGDWIETNEQLISNRCYISGYHYAGRELEGLTFEFQLIDGRIKWVETWGDMYKNPPKYGITDKDYEYHVIDMINQIYDGTEVIFYLSNDEGVPQFNSGTHQEGNLFVDGVTAHKLDDETKLNLRFGCELSTLEQNELVKLLVEYGSKGDSCSVKSIAEFVELV